MTLWNAVMIIIAVVAVSVVAYWILYTTHLKPRERCQALKGRPPISKEEGIAVATLEKNRPTNPAASNPPHTDCNPSQHSPPTHNPAEGSGNLQSLRSIHGTEHHQ